MTAELDIPGKDGTRRRAHLERVYEQTHGRVRDPRLDTQLPEAGTHAWIVFWRVWDGQRVGYTELEAYCRLTGDAMDAWEIEAIRAMDAAVSEVLTKSMRGENAGSGESTDSS